MTLSYDDVKECAETCGLRFGWFTTGFMLEGSATPSLFVRKHKFGDFLDFNFLKRHRIASIFIERSGKERFQLNVRDEEYRHLVEKFAQCLMNAGFKTEIV